MGKVICMIWLLSALICCGFLLQGCGGGGGATSLLASPDDNLNQDNQLPLQPVDQAPAVELPEMNFIDVPAGALPEFPAASPSRGVARADFPISIQGAEAYDANGLRKGWSRKSAAAAVVTDRMSLPSNQDSPICWAEYRIGDMDGEQLETISLVGGAAVTGDRYGILIANWTRQQWDFFPQDIPAYYWSHVQISNLGERSQDYISDTGDLVWCIASLWGSDGYVGNWTVSGTSDDVLAPMALVASDGDFQDRIQLGWQLSEYGSLPDGIRILRSTLPDAGFAEVADISPADSWEDLSISDDADYFYYVVAYKSGFPDSPPSNTDSGFLMRLEVPQSISASDGTLASAIRISWDAPYSGPAPESYEVFRADTENGDYVSIGNTAAGTTEFTDNTVADGETYWYSAVCRASGYSDSSPGVPDSGMRSQLAAPLELKCSKATFEDRIILSWSAPATGIAPEGYVIFRSSNQSSGYTPIDTTGAVAQWEDDSAEAMSGSVYWYRLQSARAGWVNSTDSVEDYGLSGSDLLPPQNLVVSTTFVDKIELNWTSPLGGERPDKYMIWRADQLAGPYEFVGTVIWRSLKWIDRQVPDGQTYHYKVRSVKSAFGASGYSSSQSGSLRQLDAPVNLSATTDLVGQIDVSWDEPVNAPLPDGYHIDRSDAENGIYTRLTTVPVTGAVYADSTVTDGADYWYKVVSVLSGYPEVSSGSSPPGSRRQLVPPTNVQTTSGDDSVSISWTPVPGSEQQPDDYQIYCDSVLVGSDANGDNEFTHSGIGNDASHDYEVSSVKTGWTESAKTTAVPGSALPLEPATGLSATDGSDANVIYISWSAPASGTTPAGYAVYRSSNGGNSYSLLGNDPDNASPYTDTPGNGATYFYKVKSTKSGYTDSGFSNSDSGYLAPLEPPTDLNASAGVYDDKIHLTWTAPTSGPIPGGYKIFRAFAATPNDLTAVATVGAVTQYDDPYDGVNPLGNSNYIYKVTSTKTGWSNSGNSDPSNEGFLLTYTINGNCLTGTLDPIADATVTVAGGARIPGPSQKWSYTTGGWIEASPTIGPDGSIYVGSSDSKLYAFNPDGSVQWTKGVEAFYNAPVIGPNGTIYVGSWNPGGVYAYNPDGSQKWHSGSYGVRESLAVDANGIVYAGSVDDDLYAYYPGGGLKWRFPTYSIVWSAPAIDTDGTVYVGCDGGTFYAINPDGSQKWSNYRGHEFRTRPAIGTDGTVYVGGGTFNCLYAFDPDNGYVIWQYYTNGYMGSNPTVGADGTVYVGCDDGNLYAINPDGSLKWQLSYVGRVTAAPTIGTDGTVYAGSWNNNLLAINPDGSLKWAYATGNDVYSSPAIGVDGTVYVTSYDNKLYAIWDGQPICNVSGQTDSNGYYSIDKVVKSVGTNDYNAVPWKLYVPWVPEYQNLTIVNTDLTLADFVGNE